MHERCFLMLKKKYSACPCLVIFFFALLLFSTGCGKKKAVEVLPPEFDTIGPLVPTAPGEVTLGNSTVSLDISNTDHGYMVVAGDNDGKTKSIQVYSDAGVLYQYFISSGETAVIPFTDGNGEYTVVCYQQVEGNQYAALLSEKVPVEMVNIFYPYLYPNQYVDFTPETDACKLALSLLDEDSTDVDALDAIYEYVINNVTYDENKARTVEAGYLPTIDETLHSGTGICFDYAALMTAMLRARDIPCRLVSGYAGTVHHAWIDVYIKNRGWVEQAISFDGETWSRMDPTFASAALEDGSEDFIRSYISDGDNYSMQYAH